VPRPIIANREQRNKLDPVSEHFFLILMSVWKTLFTRRVLNPFLMTC